MQQVHLPDQLYRMAQRRASEAGFATVEEYIADVVSQDAADDTENFDHLFTPQVVSELEQISAVATDRTKGATKQNTPQRLRP